MVALIYRRVFRPPPVLPFPSARFPGAPARCGATAPDSRPATPPRGHRPADLKSSGPRQLVAVGRQLSGFGSQPLNHNKQKRNMFPNNNHVHSLTSNPRNGESTSVQKGPNPKDVQTPFLRGEIPEDVTEVGENKPSDPTTLLPIDQTTHLWLGGKGHLAINQLSPRGVPLRGFSQVYHLELH